jgi:predicted nucleotidyltransferase
MLLKEIIKQRENILALSNEYGARRIRVFGSVARGDDAADSDIDFLVDFPRGYDLFLQRIPLAEQLQGLLNRTVDLVPEHELTPYIRDRVLSEAIDL